MTSLEQLEPVEEKKMAPRRPNLLIGVSLFVSVAIFLISALVLVEMRQDALRRAQEAATNLSLIVERDTSRNLEIYDLSLQAVELSLKVVYAA
ncbi:hypothetical protein ParKJ_41720 [Paraburkholderia fungorum]|uniref:Diguanylate cyclase n=1 Tax=Paraburkholderia fungorum TaxID=134537 RepID=A0AAP5QKF7_9BURK|nr:hypothetical protein [Paraburkholderia fungorum]MDT8843917.1 hypothetical protein [Paraburkholderia fungorum]